MAATRRIGILASGSGSTIEEGLFPTIEQGRSSAEIAFIVCNNAYNSDRRKPEVYERARRMAVPIFTANNVRYPDPDRVTPDGAITFALSERLVDLAEEHGAEAYVGLGWMKRLVGPVLDFGVFNEHPAPLPLTAGLMMEDAQKKVMATGAEFSGPTFHRMTNVVGVDGLPPYDKGEVIGHWDVPVLSRHREEWEQYGTATLLKDDVMRAEKTAVPLWIDAALETI